MENATRSCKKQSNTFRIHIIQYAINLMTHKILQSIIIILILIQALQLISMSIVTSLSLSSFVLEYFQYVAHVLYPDYYIRNTGLVLYGIPIIFGVSVLHMGLIIYTFHYKSRLSIIVHYLLILQTTILTVPFLSINISILMCEINNPYSHNIECYQNYHIILLIFSIINITWILMCTIFVFVLYTNKNPFYTDYYSTSTNTWVFVKFLLKIAPIIYININPTLSYGNLYTVGFAILNGVYFGFKIFWPYYRNAQNLQNWIIRIQIVTVFATAFVNAYYFIHDQLLNLGFVMSVVLGILCGQLFITVTKYKKSLLMKQIFVKENTDENQIPQDIYLQYFYTLFSGIQQSKTQYIQILPILKIHKQTCCLQTCPCLQLQDHYSCKDNPQLSKQSIYQLIVTILQKLTQKSRKNNTQLKITIAYILFYKLDKKIKSVYMMSDLLQNQKISIGQQIQVRKIFYQYKLDNIVDNSLSKYTQFSKLLWEFQCYAENSAMNCKKYWTQLIQQDCQVTKIWKMANIIANDKIKLNQLIDNVLKIFPNNLHVLNLYAEMLVLIYCMPSQAIQKYKLAIQSAQKKLITEIDRQSQILLRQNQNIGILCAAQRQQNFQYIRISSNIYNILHMRSMEMLNKNINIIMHELYQQFHDTKLKQYINQTNNNISQRNASIFLINGMDKLINCVYKTKIISSLRYGIELISFIKQITRQKSQYDQHNYIMYYYLSDQYKNNNDNRYKSGDILHIDKQLYNTLYGQDPNNDNQKYNNRTMKDLFPQWDIVNDQVIFHSEKQDMMSFNIDLVHKDQLQVGQYVKYLQLSLKNNKPYLFIDPVIQIQIQTKSKFKSDKSSKRSSFWSSATHDKLQIYSNYSISNTNQYKNMVMIPNKIINIVAIVILGVIIVLCVLLHKINGEYLDILNDDFTTIQYLQVINTKNYFIGLNLQKLLNHSIVTLPSSFNNTLTELNQYANQIYNINSIELIDSQIQIPVAVYVNDTLTTINKYTFNNALSFLLTAISILIKDISDSTQILNLQYNIQNFYKYSRNISDVSNIQSQYKLYRACIKQTIYWSIKSFTLLAIVIVLVLRIKRINDYVCLVLNCYQRKIDASNLISFQTKCQKFIRRIRGFSGIDEQAIKVKLAQLFSNNYKQAYSRDKINNQFLNTLNSQQQQQEEKLINLRKKITFQAKPSKIKYFTIAILTFIFWIGVQAILKYKLYQTYSAYKRSQDRNLIDSHYDIISKIQRLTYNIALLSMGKKNNFTSSLSDIENKLMASTQSKIAKQQIKIQQLVYYLALLKSQMKQVDFTKIQQQMKLRQQEIRIYAQQEIQNVYDSIAAQGNAFILIINLVLGFTALLLFRKLGLSQQQILNGSTLMLEMIKQIDTPLRMGQDKKDRSSMMMVPGADSLLL